MADKVFLKFYRSLDFKMLIYCFVVFSVCFFFVLFLLTLVISQKPQHINAPNNNTCTEKNKDKLTQETSLNGLLNFLKKKKIQRPKPTNAPKEDVVCIEEIMIMLEEQREGQIYKALNVKNVSDVYNDELYEFESN